VCARFHVYICRGFTPALALSILDPKMSWAESEAQEGARDDIAVHRADGSVLSAYDLKRLQVRIQSKP
jgi:N-acetyltransferase 10